MSVAGPANTDDIGRFGWLVDNFAENVPGVTHTVVVSVDGLLLAASARLPTERAEEMAAIAAGILGLNQGATTLLGGQRLIRAVVEMDNGALLLSAIKDGSCLAVLADQDSDVAQVTYEMSVLVDQVGRFLTPELRAKLAEAR